MSELGGAAGTAGSTGGARSGRGPIASGGSGAGGRVGTPGDAAGNPAIAGAPAGHAGTPSPGGNAGTPSAAGNAGTVGQAGTPGAGGNAGTSGGAGGNAGTPSAAGSAGTSAGAGGNAGASGSGGGSAEGGGGAGCSPCHLVVGKALCRPIAGATCLEQESSSQAADGTFTLNKNMCFSDGTKILEVDTSPPSSAPRTATIQRLKNGALCSTVQIGSASSVDGSGNDVTITTEAAYDPTGNLLATLVITRTSEGTDVTQTLTCAGQSPEPFVSSCINSSDAINCSTGACM